MNRDDLLDKLELELDSMLAQRSTALDGNIVPSIRAIASHLLQIIDNAKKSSLIANPEPGELSEWESDHE